MPAYIIADLSIHDQTEIEEYRRLVPSTITAMGGKFIVRGGQTTPLEGDWNPERIVVVEFPSVEKAKEWWNSELYSKAKSIRQRAATTKMILIEGI